MLTTSTDLPAAEVAQAYKCLWRVELRVSRDVVDPRRPPIFHQRDDSVIGHIVGYVLAPTPRGRPATPARCQGLAAPWPDLMRDLARLQAAIIDLDGTR